LSESLLLLLLLLVCVAGVVADVVERLTKTDNLSIFRVI
jgi:hypothetical protein